MEAHSRGSSLCGMLCSVVSLAAWGGGTGCGHAGKLDGASPRPGTPRADPRRRQCAQSAPQVGNQSMRHTCHIHPIQLQRTGMVLTVLATMPHSAWHTVGTFLTNAQRPTLREMWASGLSCQEGLCSIAAMALCTPTSHRFTPKQLLFLVWL